MADELCAIFECFGCLVKGLCGCVGSGCKCLCDAMPSCSAFECTCNCCYDRFQCCQGSWCDTEGCCSCVRACCSDALKCKSLRLTGCGLKCCCVDSTDADALCQCVTDLCWFNWCCNCRAPWVRAAADVTTNALWIEQSLRGQSTTICTNAMCDILLCPCCAMSRQWNAYQLKEDSCDKSKCLSGICLLPCLSAALRRRVHSRYMLKERGCVTFFTGMLCPLCSLCTTHYLLVWNDLNPGYTCCGDPPSIANQRVPNRRNDRAAAAPIVVVPMFAPTGPAPPMMQAAPRGSGANGAPTAPVVPYGGVAAPPFYEPALGQGAGMPPFAAPRPIGDRLHQGQVLRPGECMSSANGRYQLTHQTNGDVVLTNTAQNEIIWSTGTAGHSSVELTVTTEGQLALFGPMSPVDGASPSAAMEPSSPPDLGKDPSDSKSRGGYLVQLWCSPTLSSQAYYAMLLDDGNLVLYTFGGQPMWWTATQGK